jgi:hypothetical protein
LEATPWPDVGSAYAGRWEVACWLALLTHRQILCGSFDKDLVAKIEIFVQKEGAPLHVDPPRQFAILGKVRRLCKLINGTKIQREDDCGDVCFLV